MISAEPEKNSSVNQSIKAATLRLRVGSANAESVAKAGSESNSVRLEEWVSKAVLTVSAMNHMGKTK
jgi:hypothetical protein